MPNLNDSFVLGFFYLIAALMVISLVLSIAATNDHRKVMKRLYQQLEKQEKTV